MSIKYVHRDPEYVPQEGTNNNHKAATWAPIKRRIDDYGYITYNMLMEYSCKYGEGANKGNERFGKYLIKPGTEKLKEILFK